MPDLEKQMQEAKETYKRMLDTFLNDINQVDKKTPWQATEPKWWLEMVEIEKKIREAKANL